MNVTNDSSSYFHDLLRKMALPEEDFFVEDGKIVCLEKKIKAPKDDIFKVVDSLKKFLMKHSSELKKSDIKNINKIKEKVLTKISSHEEKNKASLVFKQFEELAKTNTQTNKKQKNEKSSEVLFQKALSPKNSKELLNNLILLCSNFPKYQLGNDLQLYDTSISNLPEDTDLEIIRKKLQNSLEVYERLTPTRVCEQIRQAQKLYTDRKIVPLSLVIINGVGNDNGAMFKNVMAAVYDGYPCVATKDLLLTYSDKFESEFKHSNSQLYVQKEGGFALVLPPGTSPKDYGFVDGSTSKDKTEDMFVPWKQEIKTITSKKLNFPKDAKNLFDSSNDSIARIISLYGHGSSPPYRYEKTGVISGIQTAELQEGIKIFNENNCKFLHISTCFSGGNNLNDIHLEDETIPFPILVESAMETYNYSNILSKAGLLKSIEQSIFQYIKIGNKNIAIPKSISQASLATLANHSVYKNKKFSLYNTMTFLFPKVLADIPTESHIRVVDDSICDIAKNYSKNQLSRFDTKEIQLKNDQASTFFFSNAVNPVQLSSSKDSFIFAAKGANSHHLIKECIFPNLDLINFVIGTFNSFESPASKAFLIGKMQCTYEGQKNCLLENILISMKPTKRQIFFRTPMQKNFQVLTFEKTKTDFWRIVSKDTIKEDQAHKEIYDILKDTAPKKRSLTENRYANDDESQFKKFIAQYFWNGKATPITTIYESLIYNPEGLTQAIKKLPAGLKRDKVIIEIFERINVQENDDEIINNRFNSIFKETFNIVEENLNDIYLKIENDFFIPEQKFFNEFNAKFSTVYDKKIFSKKLTCEIFIKKLASILNITNDLIPNADYDLGNSYKIIIKLLEKLSKSHLITDSLNLSISKTIKGMKKFLKRSALRHEIMISKRGQLQKMKSALIGSITSPLLKAVISEDDSKLEKLLLKSNNKERKIALNLIVKNKNRQMYFVYLKCFKDEIKNIPKKLILNIINMGWYEVIELITNSDVKLKKKHFKYSLQEALSIRDLKTIKLLLNGGADPNTIEADVIGNTLRNVISEKNEKTALEFIELLADKININVEDDKGNTALHYAVKRNFINVCELLMKKGADPNKKNKAGETPSGSTNVLKK